MTAINRTKGRDPNLGFGMVPSTPENHRSDILASRLVMESMTGDKNSEALLAAISRVKGLCTRSWRQDQPNWTLVWLALGLPNLSRLKWMCKDLADYRDAIKSQDSASAIVVSERLEHSGLYTCLSYFIGDDSPPQTDDTGFLYVLSTRENRSLLKIGQTGRDIPTRVKEINRATGIAYSFGARHIWRIKNNVQTEKEVHELLAEYRVRKDREFFNLDYREARDRIEAYLFSVGALERTFGVVKRILSAKKYGFIESDGLDFFFHASEVKSPRFKDLKVGDTVQFDKLDTTSGLAAADVRVAAKTDF